MDAVATSSRRTADDFVAWDEWLRSVEDRADIRDWSREREFGQLMRVTKTGKASAKKATDA